MHTGYRIAIASLGLLLACASTDGTAPATARGSAPMNLELQLGQTDLIIGEDTPLVLTLTNTSQAPLTIPDPDLNRSVPQMRLRDLTRNTQTNFGPVPDAGNEFTPPLPEPDIDLPPGGQRRIDATLLGRVKIERAGDYELTCYFRWASGEVTSPPVRFTVRPLELRSACFTGAHSGQSPYRYCLWSQIGGKASILLLTSVTFDQHGHPLTNFSSRIKEISGDVRPVLSASPNTRPFPGQWAVWVDDGKLHGIYFLHGRTQVAATPVSLESPGAALVQPVLSFPDRRDASRPAQADVATIASDGGHSRLGVYHIAADGKISSGPTTALPAGKPVWSHAVTLTTDERRVLAIMQTSAQAKLSLTRWDGAVVGPMTVVLFQWDGTVLGGGVTLTAVDTLLGATVIHNPTGPDPHACWLRTWRVDADGKSAQSPPVSITLPPKVEADRAIVALSPGGAPAALLHTAHGRWLVVNAAGRYATLPAALQEFGEPLELFWLNESSPQVILASPEHGISYHALKID